VKTGFTTSSISPQHATASIYAAAVVSAAFGLVTLVNIVRQWPGGSLLAFLDLGVCLGVAIGIVLRKLSAAWVGFIYCALNATVKLMVYGTVDVDRAVCQFMTYAVAIVCIGLYPRVMSSAVRTQPLAGVKAGANRDSHGAV
jgi:hypothetical protein